MEEEIEEENSSSEQTSLLSEEDPESTYYEQGMIVEGTPRARSRLVSREDQTSDNS